LNELHVKLQLGVPMLQFFVDIPRRQDATHLAPHPLDNIGMNRSEINFFMPVSVFLESGIEVKFRVHPTFGVMRV